MPAHHTKARFKAWISPISSWPTSREGSTFRHLDAGLPHVRRQFGTGALDLEWSIWLILRLGCGLLVWQAALSNGLLLDLAPFPENGLGAADVDVGGREVAEALVASAVVAMLDEGGDGVLEGAGKEVVLEQEAVLERLVPALDLALGARSRAIRSGVPISSGR